MQVDIKLIEHVAGIARLNLSEEEKKQFAGELKEVLAAFSKLDEINTENVPLSLQPIPLRNAMREDKEEGCLDRDAVLSLSRHAKDGYFKGPKAV
jgi:aspartyl-tRNA(Asn)/glutamyl-tRNA(Gln) amidotransferase subunit C